MGRIGRCYCQCLLANLLATTGVWWMQANGPLLPTMWRKGWKSQSTWECLCGGNDRNLLQIVHILLSAFNWTNRILDYSIQQSAVVHPTFSAQNFVSTTSIVLFSSSLDHRMEPTISDTDTTCQQSQVPKSLLGYESCWWVLDHSENPTLSSQHRLQQYDHRRQIKYC
jgi:hypothetical protein